ncbi:MAG: T9SS type A sorting domain-containing protein [bacterium]
MRFFGIFLLLLVVAFVLPLFGAQRVVLVEQFTNSGCPGCNAIKDTMSVIYEEMCNQGKIVPIAFHGWWPSGNDPFYLFNPSEIEARFYYYAGLPPWQDYFYVPSFRFEGKYLKDPSDFNTYDEWYAYFRSTVDSLFNIPSPIRIEITRNAFSADSDSVYVDFDVIAEEDVQYNMSLYLAVTEWRHRYPYPVGAHDHAFRDFVPDSDGYQISGMSSGDSLHFEWAYVVDPEYRPDRLITNIFVQRNGTKKVQQAIREAPVSLAGIEVVNVTGPIENLCIFPNPFTTATEIRFSLKEAADVKLGIYSVDGRLVNAIEKRCNEGENIVGWNGCDSSGKRLASGVYYYKLGVGDRQRSGKVVLLH